MIIVTVLFEKWPSRVIKFAFLGPSSNPAIDSLYIEHFYNTQTISVSHFADFET